MFIEINDISTGTLVTEPLNVYSIDFVYKKEIDGKFCIIYVLTNGLRKVEQFDTDTEADDRLEEIKAITI